MAARIVLVAEQLCDTADLHAGWRVLDAATGSGNAAIAAARLGCTAVGVDYVPALLERGRERAAAEGLPVEFREGDAEALPFRDGSFDAVTSVFGSMFAPDHGKAAAELLRVCRPGGTIALASWTPDGFIGELFRTVGAHVPPPAGVPSPMLWGSEGHLRELLGDGISWLEVAERTFTWRFASAEAFVAFFRLWYGPTLKAFAALEGTVSARPDNPDAPQRQQVYLRALETIPTLSIHYGHYLSHVARMPLARPRPGGARTVEVVKTEEKGSDVNLATFLLLDAFKRDCQVAVVISNDSDLKLPIEIAQNELGLRVGVVNPHPSARRSRALQPTFFKQIRTTALAACQFPPSLTDLRGEIRKPAHW